MKKKFLFLIGIIFLFLLSNDLFAQERKVKGIITEAETGNPISGVLVKIEGTEITVVSDKDGFYVLVVPDTLKDIQFSEFENRQIQKIDIIDENTINLILINSNLDLFDLSLEELMNMEIVSASNVKEKQNEAPASILVITAEDIKIRGYRDVVEIFDDLPGVDISIPYGDLYMKPYWRGMRKGMPSPFLMMIDGNTMNHLWFNWTDVATAIPLSNIERIEIVYGPASSVYGANALMGVFNIITTKNLGYNGTKVTAKYSYGENNSRIADFNVFYQKEKLRVSLTGYFNHGDLDKESLENYEYTKSKYLKDRTLWGGFLDNDAITGVSSPRNNRAIIFNTFYNNTEIGIQYYISDNGYGMDYAYDRYQPKNKWIEPDLNIYIQHKQEFNDKLSSTTLLRYRESDVSNESSAIEGYKEQREVSFCYWQSLNSSITASQVFDAKLTDAFSLLLGLQYEYKDLQKAYDLPRGSELSPSEINSATYDFPESPENTKRIDNRTYWETESVYLQTKYNFGNLLNTEASHIIHAGIRLDDNSYYGFNPTFRAAYTASINKFHFKLLYGESFQEPTPRQLYGGWTGSGSSPDLKAETSQTGEINLGYTSKNFNISASTYYNRIENMITDLEAAPENIGELDVLGIDIMTNYNLKIANIDKIRLWCYLSYTITDEQKFDGQGNKTEKGEIGDIAPIKIYAGLTLKEKNFYSNIRGRFITERNTVDTNPIDKVDAWGTVDFNIGYNNLFVQGLGISLKINNLLDTKYFHPGIRMANAGNTQGEWKDDLWHGSQGWSNSLLPQPGRVITFSLHINID